MNEARRKLIEAALAEDAKVNKLIREGKLWIVEDKKPEAKEDGRKS